LLIGYTTPHKIVYKICNLQISLLSMCNLDIH